MLRQVELLIRVLFDSNINHVVIPEPVAPLPITGNTPASRLSFAFGGFTRVPTLKHINETQTEQFIPAYVLSRGRSPVPIHLLIGLSFTNSLYFYLCRLLKPATEIKDFQI